MVKSNRGHLLLSLFCFSTGTIAATASFPAVSAAAFFPFLLALLSFAAQIALNRVFNPKSKPSE